MCRVWQHVAVCFSVYQCVAMGCGRLAQVLQRVAACCSVLQRVAECLSVLQRVAACCKCVVED